MTNIKCGLTRMDLYNRVTNAIIADLEQGVRPWLKPWNAEHAAGRITRPLRVGGQPYKGINILMLWASAMNQNFAAPIWMTFQQAKELKANIRKNSKGSLVVYTDCITKTETAEGGQENGRDIYFMKGYRLQRRADRGTPVALLRDCRTADRPGATDRVGRPVLCQYWGRHPPRWESGLLRIRHGLRADAALRVF
jgi:hypothetical protein